MKKRLTDFIGNTPLVYLENISKDLYADIYMKMECLNPWFSVKDRVALGIIEDAERSGKLKKGTRVIEATSGNTGISLAGVCAIKGYDLTIVMPEFVSEERKILLKMLGADLVLTPESQGLIGCVAKSLELSEEYESVFVADQTRNPSNPKAHIVTAQELWRDMNGNIDYFVSASGTGGHISGIGNYLKSKSKSIKVIAVEPEEAAILSGNVELGKAKANHGIIGIGPGFIPKTLDRAVIDEVIVVNSTDAYHTASSVIKKEGLLIGVSTGAVLAAAIKLAKLEVMIDKNIVVIATSASERYLTTKLTDVAKSELGKIIPSYAKKEYIDRVLSSNE